MSARQIIWRQNGWRQIGGVKMSASKCHVPKFIPIKLKDVKHLQFTMAPNSNRNNVKLGFLKVESYTLSSSTYTPLT